MTNETALREAERYCLGLLAEEMGEGLQLIGKALRFGMDTPGVKRLDGSVDMEQTPRTMLAVEIGDLLAGIDFAKLHGVIDYAACNAAHNRKLHKLTDASALDNLGRPLAPQPDLLQSPSQPVVAEAVNWKDMSWQERYRNLLQEYRDLSDKACAAVNAAQASPPPVQGERVTRHQVRMGARYLMQASAAGRLSEDEIVRVIMDCLAHSQPDTQEDEAIAALVREKEQPL